MRRRSKRLARKYSIGSLFAVLVCLCSYHLLIGRGGSGEAARRLADPEDPISLDARRSGALILHACGLLYMFVAIAIVCDECFVPALEVITEVLDLSPDVAGATFMAAGGSAPEFFTSLIGALLVESDIGTGTIIGSAVFNVLFVIGACALIAPKPLHLTWFPLARDSMFYAIDLLIVTIVFFDEQVKWYEAMLLFVMYLLYTTFMSYSERIERWAVGTAKGTFISDPEVDQANEDEGSTWAKKDSERIEKRCHATGSWTVYPSETSAGTMKSTCSTGKGKDTAGTGEGEDERLAQK